MSLRDWIGEKILTDEYGRPTNIRETEAVGAHGLIIKRDGLRDALVYCPDADDGVPFSAADLERARQELPGFEYTVVVSRGIANDAYGYADGLGVGIGSMNTLRWAAASEANLADYRSKNHHYVQTRLSYHQHIRSWARRGYDTYEIQRFGTLPSLIVITMNPYEVTQEDVYRLLSEHPGIPVDALVTTNPSCRGFSPATLQAVRNAGLTIMTFPALLDSLGQEWT